SVRVPAQPVAAYQRADPLTANGSHDIALAHEVEDHDGQIVVHAQANGRRVHELESAAQHLAVVKVLEHACARRFERISVVNTVHLGALEHRFRSDLERPLSGTGISREEWRAKASAEDDDTALFQVPDRAAWNVRLRHLSHRDRGLHPGFDAKLL